VLGFGADRTEAKRILGFGPAGFALAWGASMVKGGSD
jgi:hypothetical protein